VKPAPFRYHRPKSLGEALDALSRLEGAKLIAGGQSLGPMMNMRLVQPEDLIDLNAIAGLDFITEKDDCLEIGALACHHAVEKSGLVKKHCPLLAEAAGTIGHYAIRSRGTLGGSLAHADPAAQLPLVAATVGAQIVVHGKRGERRLAAKDFFVSMMSTALAPDEIVVSVRFPKAAAGDRHAFLQFSRRTGDFAIVAVACTLQSGKLKIGVGGAEDKPLVLEFLNEKPETIARKAREAVDPAENPRVPALYRKELVEVLVKRAVAKCLNSN
jgi:aerobic carbon-monoxide dehydrogenase medium subunit